MPATPPPTADEVRGLLRGVIDPELGSDIVELGMVRDVQVTPQGVVSVTIALTTAGCPLRGQIQRDIRGGVAAHDGVTEVVIEWGEMTAAERAAAMERA